MGVEYKLLKEVIVDMIEEQYIATSQNRITMTRRGREALKSRKLVTIQKKNINQVMVNMITGTIEEGDHITISPATRQELCLSEILSINKDFLESNYVGINDIYQKSQIESSIFQMRYTSRELYKILDIAYDKLCYVKEELLIYKNNDSDDYEFIISKDVGEGYINAFYNQVKDIVHPGLENLFERDWEFVKKCAPICVVENDEKKQTDKLKDLLYGCDEVSEAIYQEFVKTRNLVDNKEVEKFFVYQKEIQHEGIIISSNRLRKILSKKVVNMLNNNSRKKIIIIYSNEEYDIEKFLQRQFPVLLKKGKMQLIKEEQLAHSYICFYPNVFISLKESIARIFNYPMAILGGEIYFNTTIIKEKVDDLIEKKKIVLIDEQKNDNNLSNVRAKGKKR